MVEPGSKHPLNTVNHPIFLSPTPLLKNMKPILTRLFAGALLLLASQAFGQTPLTTSFVVTQPAGAPDYPIGTHIVIELRVQDFTNISSMQFPITYNKNVMRFDSLNESVFSNWSNGNFVSVPAAGKVGISWDGFSNGANMPFSFPNGTAIFKLHFTSIGDGISSVNISPTGAPPTIDVAGATGNTVPLNYQNGGTPPLITGSGNPPPPPLVGFKIVANTIYIPQGERGCMPVTVNDFDDIVSMQWAMHWDNTVLNYECSRRYSLDGLSASDINPSPTHPATVVLAWADPSGSGIDRVDGARIVDICFKAVGAPGASTTITFDGVGLPPSGGGAEAYNASSIDVWTQANHPNGASGVSAPINIIITPPTGFEPTYTVDTVNAAPNSNACVAVKVKNFTAITGSEFALSYNPTQLTYVAPPQFGANPLNLQASHITHVGSPGTSVVKFLYTNANGATVANDAAIFSVCFNVIAPIGTQCDIKFTTTPCASITGIGTAKAAGGVSMAMNNGWIRSKTSGPTITIAQQVKCANGNDGALSVANPPATVATTYAWSAAGVTGQNPTGLTAGTYTVTVTYSDGSTGTASATLTAPPSIVQTSMVNTVSCFGGNNGAIDLTASGGTAPYTYNWAHGPTTQDVTGLSVSVYPVTITDFNSCKLTANITVSGFVAINGTTTVTNVTCSGLSNGSIALTPSGGAGNYSYAWNSGESTKDLNNKAAGTYTVTITDGNTCTRSFSATIGSSAAMAASLTAKTDVKCINTPSGTATVNLTGGTGNMTFCWSTGAGPCASQVPNPTNLAAGTYTLIATDQNGCTATVSNIVIANAPSALTVSGTGTSAPCFGQATGAIDLTVGGGWSNYTYQWSGGLPSVPDPNPVAPGTYTVTVTDAGQCTATQSVTVSGPQNDITPATVIQHVTCFGSNNGGIDLNLTGGNGGAYGVVWSNTTLTGETIGTLAPGSYQPTVTDNQGCTKILPAVVVNGPTELLVSTNITEANPTNGAIDLSIISGGTPNFTYLWSNGSTQQDLTNLGEGDYEVTVTDANNCLRIFEFNVPSGNVLNNTVIDSVKNACAQDGCIIFDIPQTAASQTPFTINWGFGTTQTNSFNPSICGLNAGLYNVTITANNGNSMVFSAVQIGQNDPASVNTETQQPFSSLVKNGKIELEPASNVQCQLEYQWGPAPLNSTSNIVDNLGQGIFSVTITNPCSGCQSVKTFDLKYSDLAGIEDVKNPSCATTFDGYIHLNIQGGFLPYVYDWEGPNGFQSTLEDIDNLEAGTYTVTVTDQDGRVFTRTFVLASQSTLNITNVNETSQYGPFQVSGDGICDGVAAVVFIPGVGVNNIAWSNGVTTANNTTLCGGAYSVTITDATGCSTVWSDNLTAPAAIAITENPVSVTCFGDCNGSAKVNVGGGVGPYSVRWSTGQFDPLVTASGFSQAVNLCGGDYVVTITDDNDVQRTFTVNVPEPDEIVVSFSPTAPRNFNACDGDLLIQVSGAVAPVTYVWSGSFGHSGDNERAEELCSGEFVEYYITDANGCTAYATDSVPYPEDGCFRVSPVITPGQQDGKNDFVIITCIETANESKMEIYNRWGQLVFETEGYTNNDLDLEHNWNGLTSSGAALAEGVYYYVLTFTYLDDQGQKREGTRKGAINLLR